MFGNTSQSEIEKILIRQQNDLQELSVLRSQYVDTIKKQDEKITQLLRLLEEREEQVRKLNEVIQQMQSEKSAAYRVEASKRGERIE